MTRFRPCIDLHAGQVKQIVGASLRDDRDEPQTNFVSNIAPAEYAARYRADGLVGGHVIKLGPGNDEAARQALSGWPGGLQLGGGITAENAASWLSAGADKVIVTSWLFVGGALDMGRVEQLAHAVGKHRVVLDLSCRRIGPATWRVAADRWQTTTETTIRADTLARLADHCSEFLVHAADVEGRCEGIDQDLVRLLGDTCPLPCTYAGGARSLDDLDLVQVLSNGRVDLTIGSALDLFGGTRVRYTDCVAWNRRRGESP
ncbi:MAG: phosphoribosylformimino-5-aminoimidazole carboxamide ribotide isomerase [Myxococcales bacterium]|nr:phosphoribosylformimino-5-aminoimidazole carboxamide ribotide isomerase [Myxococcales bacterium]